MALIFAQNFLFTLVHFSFSAGQLTLAERVVTQRSTSAVVVKVARPSVMDQPPAYTAPAGLDFLQHLPDQLPDRRADRASGAVPGVTAVTPPPPQPVTPPRSLPPLVLPELPDEPVELVFATPPEAAPPPVEAPAPVQGEQFHFVTQEEADSGKFPVEAPVEEAPVAEAPQTSVSAQLISADADMEAPPEDSEDHAPTIVLDAAMVQATVAAATAGTPSPSGGRLSAGALFGDMLHEIGGQTHEEAEAPPAAVEEPPPSPVPATPVPVPAPAPPPAAAPTPPAPKPMATAPWNEPKHSVKDIFGDILEELGSELPDSEKDKPPEEKK